VRAQRLPFAGGCGFEFPIRDDISSHDELINWFMGEHKKFKKIVIPRVYEFAGSLGD
jgi:hypothetical protein